MSYPSFQVKLHNMTPNIRVLDSFPRVNIGIIQGSENLLIIDAGSNEEQVSELFARIKKKSIKFLVLTHWHADHTFGLSNYDCLSIAHNNTYHKLSELKKLDFSDEAIQLRIEQGTEYPGMLDWYKREFPDRTKLKIQTPELTFETRLEIDLGNQIVEVEHIECDHTNDCITIYVPNEESLFIGDCLSPGNDVLTISTFNKLIEDLLNYDAKIMVEGHGPPLGDRQGEIYLLDLVKLINFVEVQGQDYEKKIDVISSKIELVDKGDIPIYLSALAKGI
ncbi:MAG: MBL fold metallo-hydrolase [Promethearchaeota archaeon]